ncbi:MAG: hypothetical protein FD128_1706 [Hyphomonadaceae bacterium]|nr:MAG: hypothetical protein FD128_1706 [Hyphomonadaceae bacterium]
MTGLHCEHAISEAAQKSSQQTVWDSQMTSCAAKVFARALYGLTPTKTIANNPTISAKFAKRLDFPKDLQFMTCRTFNRSFIILRSV